MTHHRDIISICLGRFGCHPGGEPIHAVEESPAGVHRLQHGGDGAHELAPVLEPGLQDLDERGGMTGVRLDVQIEEDQVVRR